MCYNNYNNFGIGRCMSNTFAIRGVVTIDKPRCYGGNNNYYSGCNNGYDYGCYNRCAGLFGRGCSRCCCHRGYEPYNYLPMRYCMTGNGYAVYNSVERPSDDWCSHC